MEVSVIIPIYNEAQNLLSLLQRLKPVLTGLSIKHEIIFVNDGSHDESLSLIKSFAAEDPNIRYISLSRNFGHQIALSAGLNHAKGNAIVTMDGDLQDPPELIARLYAKWKEGYQVVYAQRRLTGEQSRVRRIAAKLFYGLITRITSTAIPTNTADYRIIDKKIAEVLKQMPEQHKFLRGQVAWAGFKQTAVEYDRDSRHAGHTGYTLTKLARLAVDGITAFSNFPLRLTINMGFAIVIISFLCLLGALYTRLFLELQIAGWVFTSLIVLFMGGVQLISAGIIGEYISRIGENVRNRPLYVISETNTK